MPEHIKSLSLGDILTIPLDFEVRGLTTEIGYRRYDKVKLVNERFDIELYLLDSDYEELIQEVQDGSDAEL